VFANRKETMKQPSLLVAVAILTVLAGATANCAEPALRLTISLPVPVVKAGSDVRVNVALRNIADHSVNLTFAPRVFNGAAGDVHLYRAIVTDGKGNPAAYTAFGKKIWGEDAAPGALLDGSMILVQPLNPGEEGKHFLMIGKLYDLSKPGKYTIQVTRLDLEDTRIPLKSNTITVTVEP
jgi:hypothetical protein